MTEELNRFLHALEAEEELCNRYEELGDVDTFNDAEKIAEFARANGYAVTVRDIRYGIAEDALDRGLVEEPEISMESDMAKELNDEDLDRVVGGIKNSNYKIVCRLVNKKMVCKKKEKAKRNP